MSLKTFLRRVAGGVFVLPVIFALTVAAQSGRINPNAPPEAPPTPTPRADAATEPDDGTVRVYTEEVRIPLFVSDNQGRFDPFLDPNDVVVFEDDVPQDVRSVRHLPAQVLLLLDLGGAMNPAMKTSTTRVIALELVSQLKREDSVAVMQIGKQVELLQNWTTDSATLEHILNTKLLGGTGGRLSNALLDATQLFRETPVGNRHIVLVTDGVETTSGRVSLRTAIKRLESDNITVHVVSYTAIGRAILEGKTRSIIIPAPRRTASDTVRDNDPTIPGIPRNQQAGGVTVDLDREMRRRRQIYIEETKTSERNLKELAAETGGLMVLLDDKKPATNAGADVAREIGSQYVVSYRPQRPLAKAETGEYRRLKIALRRPALNYRTREGYFVQSQKQDAASKAQTQ